MQIKAKGLLKWMFGSLVLETSHITFICYSCGKKMGRAEMVGRTPSFDILDCLSICRACWQKCKAAGIEEVDWKTITPF